MPIKHKTEYFIDSEGRKYKKTTLPSGKIWWSCYQADRWGIYEWFTCSGMMNENTLTKLTDEHS